MRQRPRASTTTGRGIRAAGGASGGAGALCLLFLAILCAPFAAAEEILVIGHPGLNIGVLSEHTVRDLYLGKTVQLSNGTRVQIVDLPPGNPVRDSFYVNVIGRDPGQMRAYWAKRVFTGKGSPPETRPDERSVIRWVAEAPGRIAYVGANALTNDDPVKVLLHDENGTSP